MKKRNRVQIIITSIYLLLSFVLIGLMLYKYITTKDITKLSFDSTLLLGLAVAYLFYYLLKNKDFLPLAVDGKKLPSGRNSNDKKIRIKNYFKESIIFSIVIVCLDLCAILILKDTNDLFMFKGISYNLNIIFNCLITFGICLIISFGLEYLVGEVSIKRFNRK